MAIERSTGSTVTGAAPPALHPDRPIGSGATPALRSTSGLNGRRAASPGAERSRTAVPAQALPLPGMVPDLAAVAPRTMRPLSELLKETAEEVRREKDAEVAAASVANAAAGLQHQPGRGPIPTDGGALWRSSAKRHGPASLLRSVWGRPGVVGTPSVARGPAASRELPVPAVRGVAAPLAANVPSGDAGELHAAGPKLARSPGLRHGEGSVAHAIANTLPAESPPTVAKRVGFVDPGPAEGTGPARPADAGSVSAASVTAAQEKVELKARQRDVARLNGAIGRLQALAIEEPERARRAMETRTLPEKVLPPDVGLHEISVDDIFDLYDMYKDVDAKAAHAKGDPGLLDLDATFGKAVDGIQQARQDVLAKTENAARRAELGMDPVPPPAPGALHAGELDLVKRALKGEGKALLRLNERAARADPKTVVAFMRRVVQTKPKPLEGGRRADFEALVAHDITELAKSAKIEPQFAARLLQRAVENGQMGASLRTDDKGLLLEVLAARAQNAGN